MDKLLILREEEEEENDMQICKYANMSNLADRQQNIISIINMKVKGRKKEKKM